MLALDGTFAQVEMPVYPRILQFFVTKCVHVYPDGRLVSSSKMGPCRRIFNASVLTRPPANGVAWLGPPVTFKMGVFWPPVGPRKKSKAQI